MEYSILKTVNEYGILYSERGDTDVHVSSVLAGYRSDWKSWNCISHKKRQLFQAFVIGKEKQSLLYVERAPNPQKVRLTNDGTHPFREVAPDDQRK